MLAALIALVRASKAGGVAGAILRLLALCASVATAAGVGAVPDVERFVEEAIAKGFDTSSAWISLGRWRREGQGWVGQVDGGYFYLDSLGRQDPRRELAATARALASVHDLSPFSADTTALSMHPRVKFRARQRFLLEAGMPPSLLAPVDTTRWQRWHDGVRPRRATLVFASSYLGNPASMFGHVLLRFDSGDREGVRDRLNYGITYGAAMPAGDPLYVAKGLFGLYPGFHSILPYYLSLQKYKYLESRDLWEYPLRLDSAVVERLLEVVWEGGAAWNRYYFFTENCATGIVRLLDVLQPDSAWTESLPSPSMPPEVVRLLRERGLASAPVRRPSQLASFVARRDRLDAAGTARLSDLVEGLPAPFDGRDSVAEAEVLDAAIDYLGWKRRKRPELAVWKRRQEALLTRRAALRVPPAEVVSDAPRSQPPEEGHRPGLLGVWAGRNARGEGLFGFSGRLAYHALEERPSGFLDGSQIEAASLDLGWAPREGSEGFRLERLDLARIRALPLWDPWLRPWAWQIRLALRPFQGESLSRLGIEGGGGLALGARVLRAWTLLGGRVVWSPWERLAQAAAGPQAEAGLLFQTRPVTLGIEFGAFEGWPRGSRERRAELIARASPGKDFDLAGRIGLDGDGRPMARFGVGVHR